MPVNAKVGRMPCLVFDADDQAKSDGGF